MVIWCPKILCLLWRKLVHHSIVCADCESVCTLYNYFLFVQMTKPLQSPKSLGEVWCWFSTHDVIFWLFSMFQWWTKSLLSLVFLIKVRNLFAPGAESTWDRMDLETSFRSHSSSQKKKKKRNQPNLPKPKSTFRTKRRKQIFLCGCALEWTFKNHQKHASSSWSCLAQRTRGEFGFSASRTQVWCRGSHHRAVSEILPDRVGASWEAGARSDGRVQTELDKSQLGVSETKTVQEDRMFLSGSTDNIRQKRVCRYLLQSIFYIGIANSPFLQANFLKRSSNSPELESCLHLRISRRWLTRQFAVDPTCEGESFM